MVRSIDCIIKSSCRHELSVIYIEYTKYLVANTQLSYDPRKIATRKPAINQSIC